MLQPLKSVHGEFNGRNMIGDDGIMYEVPGNYASKSRLLQGDRLRMDLMPNGAVIYKQIEPQRQTRIIARVQIKNGHSYNLVCENKTYRLLKESATYFKVQDGDNVVALIPAEQESDWAVIDNVVGKLDDDVELNNY